MVKQEAFAVEQFMDKHETSIVYNMGETCVDSLTIPEIVGMDKEASAKIAQDLLGTKLTYGHIKGSPELRGAIAALYEGSGVTAEDVVVTNGAIAANFLTFYTVVNPQEHVIVVAPSYQQLSSVPEMFGAKVDMFNIRAEDLYRPRLDELRTMISQNNTRLLVINNPNNPSGFVWENDILAEIVALCKEHDVTIMCDEVYRPLFHFQTQEPVKSIVDFGYDKAISTGSMSKAFSLAGLRVGWIVTKNKEYSAGFWEKRDYNTISVLMLDDTVAAVALQNTERILERNHKICQTNLAVLQKFVDEHSDKVSWVRPRGGSTCFLQLHIKATSMEFAEKLIEKHGTLVVPGEVFGMPGWLRLGFGNSTHDISEGLRCFGELLQQY
ncbi:PLP-dependent transferase [Metschnikowia bicuspidata var. bicuspidata NRRL YB-4993]|uniref:PLP-dependent transferase n=1 Tax=Metschnikowia bicuspidata var. bicuspidata NRRL YB-4993 TaxID=869754 RepID=A0A1A0HEQ0_9ASCO|nr:PLP-dependent transferase [Metschnikowia bicuspidata var. bicuspidata NRRL YB-4993]OBA22450.1 PLP-dependent transferase [Metschnikowia bicuspidata var. bicuspidata NRRL YB-4993]